ncbi:MAG: hypothetical protein ACE5GS_14860 [Kiloniellaceae bacterium]
MESEETGLISLLPLIVLAIPVGFINLVLARRKGMGIASKIAGFVPFVQYFVWMYIIGLTDKEVLEQLSRIEKKLGAGAN